MSKSYIYAIIIILALIVGGGIYYSRQGNVSIFNNSGNFPQVSNEKNLIIYTDSGFSPKSINIKVGDTVMFRNDSSRGMWVASAPHPVHTDYPAFDAKKVFGKGEAYSFTFDKVGNWKFHNHMNPLDFGSVTVEN